MRFLLILYIILSTIGLQAASAQITVVESDDTVIYDFEDDTESVAQENYFTAYLRENGFNALYTNVGLAFDQPGTLTFDLLGNTDSVSRRMFFINDERVTREIQGFAAHTRNGGQGRRLEGEDAIYNIGDPSNLSQQNPNADGSPNLLLDLYFATLLHKGHPHNPTNSTFVTEFTLFSDQFGIFVPQIESTSGLTTVIFALEDGLTSVDYDDLVIRATFTPTNVPEPATLAILMLGLLVIAYRQRKARTLRQAV